MEIQRVVQNLRDETFVEASMFSFQDFASKLIINAYGRDPSQFTLSDL